MVHLKRYDKKNGIKRKKEKKKERKGKSRVTLGYRKTQKRK